MGINLGDDADKGTQDKGTAACPKQIERLICCLHDCHHVCLKGKAGKSHAEPLGLRIFPRRVNGIIIGIGVLRFYIMKLLAFQRLCQ